jgi:hypothetical protein
MANALLVTPSWLPSFAQQRQGHRLQTKVLEEEVKGDWCPMWRRVVDMQTYEILEDSPGPHQPLDFERPLDLWVCWWGLPLDFVKLSAFSSHAVLPIQVEISSGGPVNPTICGLSTLISWTRKAWIWIRGPVSRTASNQTSSDAFPA